jgi:(1->4)-alpha-D-glucan 1-alpha-D-glucosylmutase
VPDIYQGCELWDQSLVDPDNRRPVDFAKRSDLLARGQVPAHAEMPGGSAKLALTHRLLAHRREHPGLFMEGSYEPILIEGPDREDLVAFQRSHESHRLLLAAWLRPARSPDPETRVPVPACKWRNLLDHDRAVSPEPDLLFARLPVAVLVNA